MPKTTEARTFTALEVCRAAGCSYRQIDYWVRTGAMVPSVQEATGSGTQRLFSVEDLRDCVLYVQIRKYLSADVVTNEWQALRTALRTDPLPTRIEVVPGVSIDPLVLLGDAADVETLCTMEIPNEVPGYDPRKRDLTRRSRAKRAPRPPVERRPPLDVPPVSVPCPTCLALPNHPCRGDKLGEFHVARERTAGALVAR